MTSKFDSFYLQFVKISPRKQVFRTSKNIVKIICANIIDKMGISPQKSRKKKRKWLKDLKTEANQELNIAQSQFKSNLCSFAWWKQALILVSIIAFYFVSSIALTFYQKDLILRLPFPLSIGKEIKIFN